MKRVIFFLSALSIMAGSMAQTVNLHLTNGKTVKYDLAEIDSIDFSAEGSANDVEGAVDLGLSVLWATCNVGAEAPEDYGDYYAWGETETKTFFYQYNYSRHVGNGSFNSIGSNISSSQYYDAATVNKGGTWRMPTIAEMKELINKCTWKRTTSKGVAGYLVTGTNENEIFIPASGSYIDDTKYTGNYANLWTSEPVGEYNHMCYRLLANSDGIELSTFPGFYGCAVRAVCDKTTEEIGGGSTNGGDGWVSVSATGYAPYYYCPTSKTTTPSTKVATTINAYRNTSTGAYKVTWAGTDYACSAGYNKITLSSTAHTTTNSYGKSIVCSDPYYLEFTISN